MCPVLIKSPKSTLSQKHLYDREKPEPADVMMSLAYSGSRVGNDALLELA